ncbi:hypothetical protein IWQ57_001231 [Coemansia nantahalensis]|uniref:Uncharacterized protein n=1 Tax=Coemansia nantahalensis TaxID=2789366 RepID=A0ACC1K4R7_9FUNG|nr:hypothetical protein IWQ57_001231 [Coemansia nantahalensis]
MRNRVANLATVDTWAKANTYDFLLYVAHKEFYQEHAAPDDDDDADAASRQVAFPFAELGKLKTIRLVYTRLCVQHASINTPVESYKLPAFLEAHFRAFLERTGFGRVVAQCPSVLADAGAKQVHTAVRSHVRRHCSKTLYRLVRYHLNVRKRVLKSQQRHAGARAGATPSAADEAAAAAADAWAGHDTAVVVAATIAGADGVVPGDVAAAVRSRAPLDLASERIIARASALYALIRRGVRSLDGLEDDADVKLLQKRERKVYKLIKPILDTYPPGYVFPDGSIYRDMVAHPEAHLHAYFLARHLLKKIPKSALGKNKVPSMLPVARSGTIHVQLKNSVIHRCILTGEERLAVKHAEAAAADSERAARALARVAKMHEWCADRIPLAQVAAAEEAAAAAADATAAADQAAPQTVVDTTPVVRVQSALVKATWMARVAEREQKDAQQQHADLVQKHLAAKAAVSRMRSVPGLAEASGGATCVMEMLESTLREADMERQVAARRVATTQAALARARAAAAEVTAIQERAAKAAKAAAKCGGYRQQKAPAGVAQSVWEAALQAARAARDVEAEAKKAKRAADKAEKAEKDAAKLLPRGVKRPLPPIKEELNIIRLTTPRLQRARMLFPLEAYARLVRPVRAVSFYGVMVTNGVSISMFFETQAERCKRVKKHHKPQFDEKGRIIGVPCDDDDNDVAYEGEGGVGPTDE